MGLRYRFPDEGFQSVEELSGKPHDQQAKKLADYFAAQAAVHPEPERLAQVTTDPLILTPEEIEEIIAKDSKTEGTHPDDLPFKLIRHCRKNISKIWSHLTNIVILQEKVPRGWKKEMVTPIPKVPDPPNMSKIRNISLLPYANTVFEKLFEILLLLCFSLAGCGVKLWSNGFRGWESAWIYESKRDGLRDNHDFLVGWHHMKETWLITNEPIISSQTPILPSKFWHNWPAGDMYNHLLKHFDRFRIRDSKLSTVQRF